MPKRSGRILTKPPIPALHIDNRIIIAKADLTFDIDKLNMVKTVKDRHQAALQYPVVSTNEMINPACKKIVHLGNLRITSMLTIDCIEGDPKWHVSAAPLPLAPLWSTGAIAQEILDVMYDHAAKLLEKVGTGEMYGTPPTNFVHVFRALTALELEKIKKHIKRGH